MNELSSVPTDELEYTLEAAVMEAVDDSTFKKVNRCSYNASTRNVTNNLLNNTGSSADSQLFFCSSSLLSFILFLFLYLFPSFFLCTSFLQITYLVFFYIATFFRTLSSC